MPTVTPDPAPNRTIAEVIETVKHNNLHPQYCTHIPDVRVQIDDDSTLQHTMEGDVTSPLDDSAIHLLPEHAEQRIPTFRMMQQVAFQVEHPTKPFHIHIDGGSNRSVSNDRSLLIHYRNIKKTTMNCASQEGPILTCTGERYLPWRANSGQYLFVKCLYSPEVAETILLPTDVCLTYNVDFNAWSQYSNMDTGKGTIRFIPRDNSQCVESLYFTTYQTNGLWYWKASRGTYLDYDEIMDRQIDTIRSLT
jgi:hypothetical protein